MCLHCFAIDEDEFGFCEVAKNLKSAEFLTTQREKIEAARMRAITNAMGKKGKKHMWTQRLDPKR